MGADMDLIFHVHAYWGRECRRLELNGCGGKCKALVGDLAVELNTLLRLLFWTESLFWILEENLKTNCNNSKI